MIYNLCDINETHLNDNICVDVALFYNKNTHLVII